MPAALAAVAALLSAAAALHAATLAPPAADPPRPALAAPALPSLDDAPVVLAQVVFRHGDRTPDEDEMELYPDNPYAGNTFYPFGLKALTNAGKQRLHRLGLQLRQQYENFLSRTYIPTQIKVRTTDYERTKMSALSMLAGLYPPEGVQLWNENLYWQPIPYDMIPFDDDDMMYYYTCERYNQARMEELYKPSFQKRLAAYETLFDKLNVLTGRNLTTPEEVFYLDNLFQAEASYGLVIPKWATQLMPKIQEMTKIEYDLEFHTNELRKLAGGVLVKEIIDNMLSFANGTLPADRKFHAYSGHENNVAAVLACLDVFQPHQPAYGSTVAVELRRRISTEQYVVTILYIRHVGSEPEVLIVPGCEMICPLEKLAELVKSCLLSKEEHDRECKIKNDTIP